MPTGTGALGGTVAVPGDKSVTHRALLLGAVAEGETVVRGALAAGDTLSTARAMGRLGAQVSWPALSPSAAPHGADDLRITGVAEPRSPEGPLDCGNAGTLARLVAGLLAGRAGRWTLDGDASLRSRPMGRVTEPLRGIGARIDGDRLPLAIHGATLAGGTVRVDVPSAQVKSALLLAGLTASSPLTVVQHALTRDHTERMLPRFGIRCETEPGAATVTPGRPRAAVVDVPGDPSSAAFLVVAALLVPGSRLSLTDVGLWPRRTGFLRALDRAGADVEITRRRDDNDPVADPVGDLRVRASHLSAFDIAPEDVPDLVDEIPILALAAACAEGTSRFSGLVELRVKESDRIATVAELVQRIGAGVDMGDDTLTITGTPRPAAPASCDHPDHRLAMTAAVAQLVAGAAPPPALPSAEISFPGFAATLADLASTTRA